MRLLFQTTDTRQKQTKNYMRRKWRMMVDETKIIGFMAAAELWIDGLKAKGNKLF